MAENKINGKIYPHDLYVARDREGNIKCYSSDPMRTADREGAVIDLLKLIDEEVGGTNVANPACVRLNIAHLDRTEDFYISQPESIRMGKLDAHFEDLEGHVIEILMQGSGDIDYPLNGVLLDRDGNFVGNGKFNFHGECSDGNPDHTVVLVAGTLERKDDKQHIE